jgi:flagellar biosynthesis GTPase FlhF
MKLQSFIAGPAQVAPGFSPGDMDAAADPAACFARRPEIDTHLILQATAKSADLTSVEVSAEVFRPSKLLFTRADEVSPFGPAFSETVRRAKPISLPATGQRAPEDFEGAAKPRAVELVLRRNSGYGAFAAGNDYGR